MHRLTVLVALAILLVALLSVGLSDAAISVADTGTPDDEVISTISKTGNSSASATITITMTGVLNE